MDPFEQQLLTDLRDRQDRLEEEFHSSVDLSIVGDYESASAIYNNRPNRR